MHDNYFQERDLKEYNKYIIYVIYLEVIVNIFKKWKKHCTSCDILNLTYDYKNIELGSSIQVNNIYILKKKNDLIFFVKKDNWKKYIGVNRDWLTDLYGKAFSNNCLYKSTDLKKIKRCYESDIPKELIEETFDELIKYKDDLKSILEDKKKEEFYK